jgi:phosphoribosyl 1,2-cyclic phosphodiesterase
MYASLNSGSNGNCYFVGNQEDGILMDAGLICKETIRRMRSLDLSMNKIRAIFISHEHIDHVRGLDVLTRTFQIPVYMNEKTRKNHHQPLEEKWVRYLDDSYVVDIGALRIHTFSKHHDAADPISFRVEHQGHSVGVFTDIGMVCENLQHHFSQCHAAFLEANYDEDMLANGSYPIYLKKRISGDKGHLSNKQALHLFQEYRPSFMQRLLLAHLSQHNNHPDVALATFATYAKHVKVEVASRHHPTVLFSTNTQVENKTAPTSPVQLNIFGS